MRAAALWARQIESPIAKRRAAAWHNHTGGRRLACLVGGGAGWRAGDAVGAMPGRGH